MRILALDLATHTGWCLGEPGCPVTVGSFRLPKTGNNVGQYLNAFERWLIFKLADEESIDVVIFESPILRSGNTQIATLRKLYGLAGVAEMVCQKRRIQCAEVTLSTVKKTLAGHGRAEKSEMIAAAKARGISVENDNEADAFGVYLCAVSQAAPDQMAAYDPIMAGRLT